MSRCFQHSKPSLHRDRGDVLSGVVTHAVDCTGAGPQHCPSQVVWVPLDLGVEEVDGGVLGPQQFVGIIEVLPGLGDRPPCVVVKPLVLVSADNMPGLEGLDLVNRVPPWPEAAPSPSHI